MRPSPVQLLQVLFKKVSIELDEAHAPKDPPNPLTAVFTFDGVAIHTEVGIAETDPSHPNGTVYFVSLRVMVDNKVDAEAELQKFCPYKIDVQAQAMLLVRNGAEKLASIADLASVNGAALLWSSIREQVLAISSRMPIGAVMLPTVHFQDLTNNGKPSEAVSAVKRVRLKKPTKAETP